MVEKLTPELDSKREAINAVKAAMDAKANESIDKIRGTINDFGNGEINRKSISQLTRKIREMEDIKIPNLKKNWDDAAPKEVQSDIEALHVADEMIEDLKEYYIGLRELILHEAHMQRDKLADELHKAVIEKRLISEPAKWEKNKNEKIEEVLKMTDRKDLVNSRIDHVQKIEDAKTAFAKLSNEGVTKAVRSNLLNLLKKMKAANYSEAEIKNIENGYLASLQEVIKKIDEELLKKPINPEDGMKKLMDGWEASYNDLTSMFKSKWRIKHLEDFISEHESILQSEKQEFEAGNKVPASIQESLDKLGTLNDSQRDILIKEYFSILEKKISAAQLELSKRTPKKQAADPDAGAGTPDTKKELTSKALQKKIDKWESDAQKDLDKIPNSTDLWLKKKRGTLEKEVNELDGGTMPKKVLTAIKGLNADDSDRLIKEYVAIRKNVFDAIKKAYKARTQGSKEEAEEDNQGKAEKFADEVRNKIDEWRNAIAACIETFKKLTAEQQKSYNLNDVIPANIDDYLDSLKIDVLTKDKLREEFKKMREEFHQELRVIHNETIQNKKDDGIVIEGQDVKNDIEFEINEEKTLWIEEAAANLERCKTMDKAELTEFIKDKKEQIKSFNNNFDGAPEAVRNLIEKVKEKNVGRATQLKNDYMILQEDLFMAAQDIYEEIRDIIPIASPSPDSSSANEKIDQLVIDKFEKELNIKKEELETIKGFNELSTAQQLLVLNNLQQLTLGRVEEEGENRLNAKQTGETFLKSKLLAKVKNAIAHNYYSAKEAKEVAKEYREGGIDLHRKTLEKLTSGFLAYGPEATIDDEGKIILNFSKELGFIPTSEKQEELLNEFNTIAQEFSETPDEWLYDTADVTNRGKYLLRRRKYKQIKGELLEEIKDEVGKRLAMINMVKVDMKVQMNQFLNTHPDAIGKLDDMANEKVLGKAALKTIGEKGIYAGLGFVAKGAAVTAFSTIGAPLAAAGLGATFALRRAVKSMEKNDKLARRGKESMESESKDYAEANYYNESIEFLLDELDRERTLGEDNKISDKKAELLKSLRWHFEEAEKKKQKGQINYGAHEDGEDFRFANQYRFMENLSKAAVTLSYYNLFEGDNAKDRANEHWFKYLSINRKGEMYDLTGTGIGADQKKYEVESESYYKKVFEAYNQDKETINQYVKKQWFDRIAKRSFFAGKTVSVGAVTAASFAAMGMIARDMMVDDSMGIKGFLSEKGKEIKDLFKRERGYSPFLEDHIKTQPKVEMSDEAKIRKEFNGSNVSKSEEPSPRVYMERDYSGIKDIQDMFPIDNKVDANIVIPKDVPKVPLDYPENIQARAIEAERIRFEKQMELATIQKGAGSNSIEGVFIKQLSADPARFGFDGDVEDEDAVKAWAGRKAHLIAIDNGYFDNKTGEGIRMKGSSIDRNAYILKEANGKVAVDEYVNGELRESKAPGSAFERSDKDDNEYIHQEYKPGNIRTVTSEAPETSAKPVAEVKPDAGVKPANAFLSPEERIEYERERLAALNSRPVENVKVEAPASGGVAVPQSSVETIAPIEKLQTSSVREFVGASPVAAAETPAPEQPSVARSETISHEAVDEQRANQLNNANKLSAVRLAGISNDDIAAIGIRPNAVWTERDNSKLDYLMERHYNVAEGVKVIKLADAMNADYHKVGEHYAQLSKLEDIGKQKALIEILESKDTNLNKRAFLQLFMVNGYEEQVKTVDNVTTIKDVAKGYDLVVTNDSKDIRFGLRGSGSLGKSFGEDGWSRIVKKDMELSEENIAKMVRAVDELNEQAALPEPKEWR